MFKVELNQNDLNKILNAVKGVSIRATIETMDTMQRKCSVTFAQLFKVNIISQKYATGWKYSKSYKDWKEKYYGQLNFWMLSGDLYKAIHSSRYLNGYLGGVPMGAFDSGVKSWSRKDNRRLPIARYGWWLELGNRNGTQPARPILGPTINEYMTSGDWINKGIEALNKVKQQWT